MGRVRRRGTFGTVLVLALALIATGCDAIAERSTSVTLRVGYDTLDGSLAVWPGRGGLADDRQAPIRVTNAVDEWRTPTGDRVHLASSGILWLGEVDAVPLALVAANVPGGKASWLLQLSGQGGEFTVDRASEYTDPGYLVYADVLPVHLPAGRRYLTSTRVQRLVGPTGDELRVDDGLSAPVDVPGCSAVAVTASLRATTSLPEGEPAERLIDLGTATRDPRYPLVRDEIGSGVAALDGLDTCSLAGKAGPFGSIPREDPFGEEIDGVPVSWPLDRITTQSLGEFPLDQGQPVRLDRLDWRADAGGMSAVVYRPPTGSPVASRADRAGALRMYVLPLAPAPLVVLAWQPGPDTALSVPPGASRLVDEPGLVVLRKAPGEQTYSLRTPDETHYRSLRDRDIDPAGESD